MFGCLIFFSIVISLIICASIPLLFDFSMIFIAYFFPVAFSVTSETVANVPTPNFSPKVKTRERKLGMRIIETRTVVKIWLC